MAESKIWYLYIIRCKNGSLYTGITVDIDARIKKHNLGKGAKSVKMMGLPVSLVYTEVVGTHSEALKRECQIKKFSKNDKEELIK